MPNTTRFALRSPDGSVNADVPRDIQYLAADVDPWLSRARPRTSAQISALTGMLVGDTVTNTDTGRVVFWNGTAWRPVGGGASGTVIIGSVSITTTAQTFAYFIGLGFEEVQFTFSGAQGQFLAVTDPVRAQGFSRQLATNQTFTTFAPGSVTTRSDMYTLDSSSVNAVLSIRNIRIESDGYLRFELFSTAAFTTMSVLSFNWRAR